MCRIGQHILMIHDIDNLGNQAIISGLQMEKKDGETYHSLETEG